MHRVEYDSNEEHTVSRLHTDSGTTLQLVNRESCWYMLLACSIFDIFLNISRLHEKCTSIYNYLFHYCLLHCDYYFNQMNLISRSTYCCEEEFCSAGICFMFIEQLCINKIVLVNVSENQLRTHLSICGMFVSHSTVWC